MVDTRRTLAELQALLADNTSGDISAQDVRDFLLSMSLQGGAYFLASQTLTTISTTGVYVKMAGATTEIRTNNFTATANRLTYDGLEDIGISVFAFVSFSCSAKDQIGIQIALNGAVIGHSKITTDIGVINDIAAVSAMASPAAMSTNDFVELFVGNEDDSSDITVHHAIIIAASRFV